MFQVGLNLHPIDAITFKVVSGSTSASVPRRDRRVQCPLRRSRQR
jgi:hypothetical protein